MPNDENKIILEFPATNVEIELGETITFDNISGFLDAERVTYNGDSLTEKITHLEDDKADTTYVNTELGKKADKSNTYTKTETNNLVSPKADKTYVDSVADTKADKDTTYTKSDVDTLIDNLPEPMVFKGTLGVGGTIQSLPTASASNEGWTYKVITDGTYAGQTAKVGDVFTSNGSAWVLMPSGDTDTDTWRNIKVNGTEVLGNGISSGAVDFEDTANVKFEFDANGNKVRAKLDGIYTDSEVDDLLDDKADADNTYTKAQVDDIVYGILPDDTASGSVANFETDLALPIKSLEVDVNAVQDLHGYGSAWVAGAGKNVVDTRNIDTTTAGVHVTSDADGIISMSGTRDASTGWKTFAVFNDFTPGDYVFSTNNSHVTCLLNYTQKTSKFTVNTGDVVRLGLNLSSGDVVSDTNIKVQIEKGSIATEWTPYENICPISGRSEISLVKCGKNFANVPNITGSFWGDNNASLLNFINSLPVGSFVFSYNFVVTNFIGTTGNRYGVYFENPNGSIDARILKDSVTQNVQYSNSKSFTITESTKGKFTHAYLHCGRAGTKDTVTFSEFMCEVGSTKSDYEPYIAPITEVINLGGTYYGGHFTQDKAGHRQFEVTHGYRPFSMGMSAGLWSESIWGGKTVYTRSLPCKSNGLTTLTGARSEIYEEVTPSSLYNRTEPAFCINYTLIRVRDNRFSTFDEWKEAVKDYYYTFVLETPIIIDLPDGEPITTLVGTNNLFADSGDSECAYKESVELYVQKRIAEVQALVLG